MNSRRRVSYKGKTSICSRRRAKRKDDIFTS